MSDILLALDGSISPYLPTRRVLDALEHDDVPERSAEELADLLRYRLAYLHGVAATRIALFPNDATRLEPLLHARRQYPLIDFVPNEGMHIEPDNEMELIEIERSRRFRIETEQIARVPPGSVVLVVTPNDPTGTAIASTTAAQLARRSALLILDERSAEMQRRSMIPLVEEFDSIVLVRSFDDWAGLGTEAPAYAITTAELAAELDRPGALSYRGLAGALAAVSDAARLDTIAHRVRLERLRLYRMLRKSNFLRPLPSDAGYVLVEVVRGERDAVTRQLRERDIAVYVPRSTRLDRHLRFSAISPIATQRLQHALCDISRTM